MAHSAQNLDPELTMHAVLNAMIGSQRRLASLGNKVEAEYGNTVDRLFRETVRIMLLGLRAPEPSSRIKSTKKPHDSEASPQEEIIVTFHSRVVVTLTAGLALLAPMSLRAATPSGPRLELAADHGWKFLLWRSHRCRVTFIRGQVLALHRPATRLEH